MRLALSLILVCGLLLAGGIIFVERRASARETEAQARFPPLGQMLTVNGRKIHAVVMGQGPDLVLIHGAGGNLRDFTFDLAGRLAPHYRVIMLDRPGAGYSERASVAYESLWTTTAESPREQAELLQQAAAQLGAVRPIVLGHSYGATVAIAWAVYFPDRIAALVDISGPVMPWPGGLSWFYNVNGSLAGGVAVPPLLTAFATQGMIDDSLIGVFAPNPVPVGYADSFGVPLSLRRSAIRANARQVSTLRPLVVEMSPLYPQITIPVEIVHGDADVTVPLAIHSEPLSRLVPDAHLTVLHGVGHMPHHIYPDTVIAAIDRAAARAGLR
ncbi:MAG: alpha/beta hydrolase [Rhodobacterales bacterium]|nr:alpha/beta hydrolase [Rhodobacterales bacterium]